MSSKSFTARLDQSVLDRLDRSSARTGDSRSRVAERLIDEGLRMEEFPGIAFRSGPAGRRAALVDGPDVWEVVRDLHRAAAAGLAPVDTVVATTDLREDQVRLANAYYGEFGEEIDRRIRREEELAGRLQRDFAPRRA